MASSVGLARSPTSLLNGKLYSGTISVHTHNTKSINTQQQQMKFLVKCIQYQTQYTCYFSATTNTNASASINKPLKVIINSITTQNIDNIMTH